jgi:hypothetical protein
LFIKTLFKPAALAWLVDSRIESPLFRFRKFVNHSFPAVSHFTELGGTGMELKITKE